MADIHKFPDPTDRLMKEMDPFFKDVAYAISFEVKRFLAKHHPEILADAERKEIFAQIWYAFICEMMAKGPRQQAIDLVGAERVSEMLHTLLEKVS